jgi:hypothetical protein
LVERDGEDDDAGPMAISWVLFSQPAWPAPT